MIFEAPEGPPITREELAKAVTTSTLLSLLEFPISGELESAITAELAVRAKEANANE
jgi:hypothetical protein